MRATPLVLLLLLVLPSRGAEVESRVLTHYVPQDFLETVVRTEGWTKLPLDVKGGVRKGDVVRIWAGGSIDYGNGDRPGQHITGPAGGPVAGRPAPDLHHLVLSAEAKLAWAVLFKTEGGGVHACAVPGKPLQIKLTKDKEQVWIGFNDERGRYRDNHLGRGARHELDPLWVRIEVVRIIVD